MAQLRQELAELGLENVETYINSGNIFFDSSKARTLLVESLQGFFEVHYPFIKSFSLVSQEDYEEELRTLPAWWFQEMARKDVLFYTEVLDRESVEEKLRVLKLRNEVLYFGKVAVFWGKLSEETYAKTAYHKQLLKLPFYRKITIRNANTFDKIGQFFKHK